MRSLQTRLLVLLVFRWGVGWRLVLQNKNKTIFSNYYPNWYFGICFDAAQDTGLDYEVGQVIYGL